MDKIFAQSFISLRLVHPILHIPAKSSVYYPNLMNEAYENKSDNHVNFAPFTPSHFIRWFPYLTQVAGYLSSSASQSEINAIANANLAVALCATVTQS